MNIQPILIRRELWEHRALWIVPLVVAGLVIAAAMLPHAAIQLDDDDLARAKDPATFFAIFHAALTLPQFLLLGIVLPFYLLDCLFAERKDRSILFWKSLPVSDAQTVLSKLTVALIVVPLGVYVLTVITDMAATAILAARFGHTAVLRPLVHWDIGMWLHTQGFILAALIVVVLWYAPIAAYLLLVSAWAKRNVTLWATVPPLLAYVVERIGFHSHYVGTLIDYRANGIWGALDIEHQLVGREEAGGSAAMFHLSPFAVLSNIDLWLGLIATAGLVWLTIRIRRHQTEI